MHPLTERCVGNLDSLWIERVRNCRYRACRLRLFTGDVPTRVQYEDVRIVSYNIRMASYCIIYQNGILQYIIIYKNGILSYQNGILAPSLQGAHNGTGTVTPALMMNDSLWQRGNRRKSQLRVS